MDCSSNFFDFCRRKEFVEWKILHKWRVVIHFGQGLFQSRISIERDRRMEAFSMFQNIYF